MTVFTCETCGNSGETTQPHKRFCSSRCYWKAANKRRSAEWKQAYRIKRAKVKPEKKLCAVCGSPFEQPIGHLKIYCSPKCAMKVTNAKRKDYLSDYRRNLRPEQRALKKAYMSGYYAQNRDHLIKASRARCDRLGSEHQKKARDNDAYRERCRAAMNRKYSTDATFRIATLLSHQIHSALHLKTGRGKSSFKLLPYTRAELKRHVESFFTTTNGFTWENHGAVWHLDHVIPRSWFCYSSDKDPQFQECWSLSNLRPQRKEQNLGKLNRFAGYWNDEGRLVMLLPSPLRSACWLNPDAEPTRNDPRI